MNIDYTGKVVLVTGGTSGIGKAAAIEFAKAGGKVVVSGRREKEGTAVVGEIERAGGNAAFFHADVAQEKEVKAAVDFAVATYGRLDVAYNNAGIEAAGPLEQMTEAEYRRTFDINVWGTMNAMRYEIPAMLQNGRGAIVNTSSVVGRLALPGMSLYTATKHAIEGMTKSVALEYASKGIRVNAVAPGSIVTEMIDRLVGPNEKDRAGLISFHPIGRLGEPKEVAAAVVFLASDQASFITGASLAVDGGWQSR